ncbi:transcription antitermination factor NusB [Salinibacterium sp. G-O1]|uniref:transcription antitermination factor NusB n=1 Tax=Salinibacterium sp. G-O1 TaxID=3046208 RepID=UPI0024BAA20E|nr:transcription antitermination factor NusB [Salinibacterium sp. G-O1]MDJ0335196.1 transcription antitermination factor NusB [Salinibacterium sp. G-O1]
MGARTKSRKRALDVLYGADVREESINAILAAEQARADSDTKRSSSWPYARDIVIGITEHGDEIDELIETYSQDWTLARMPAIDRALLRMGVWEILYNSEVPDSVAISEAVESAKLHSTEDSAGFVNGLLGRIAASRA